MSRFNMHRTPQYISEISLTKSIYKKKTDLALTPEYQHRLVLERPSTKQYKTALGCICMISPLFWSDSWFEQWRYATARIGQFSISPSHYARFGIVSGYNHTQSRPHAVKANQLFFGVSPWFFLKKYMLGWQRINSKFKKLARKFALLIAYAYWILFSFEKNFSARATVGYPPQSPPHPGPIWLFPNGLNFQDFFVRIRAFCPSLGPTEILFDFYVENLSPACLSDEPAP